MRVVTSMAVIGWMVLAFAYPARAASVSIGSLQVVVGDGFGTTSANGTGVNATIVAPSGCEVLTGNVFVAEPTNHVIRSVTVPGYETGVAWGIWNESGIASPNLASPYNFRYNATGSNGYIVDFGANAIYTVTAPGVWTPFVGGTSGNNDGTGLTAQFNGPADAALHPTDGYLVVAETGSNRLRKVTAEGVVTGLAGVPGVGGYQDGAYASAEFLAPSGVVYAEEAWYVADSGNFVIRKLDGTAVSTVAGNQTAGLPADTADGVGAAASFKAPTGLAYYMAAGVIYIADKGDNTIRRYTIATAQVDTVVGNGTQFWTAATNSINARIGAPSGVCLSATELYIVGDNAVAVVTLAENVTTTTEANTTTTDGNGTTTTTTTTDANGTDTNTSTTSGSNGTTTTGTITTEGPDGTTDAPGSTTPTPVNSAVSATVAIAFAAAAVLAVVA